MDVSIVAQKLSAHSLEESNDVSLLEDESEAGYWSLELESDEPGDQYKNYRDSSNEASNERSIQLNTNPGSPKDQTRIIHKDHHLFVESTNEKNAFNSNLSSSSLDRSPFFDNNNYANRSQVFHSYVTPAAAVMPSLVTVKSEDVESLKRFTTRTSSVFKVFTRCADYCTLPDRSSCRGGISEMNVDCSYRQSTPSDSGRNILDVPKSHPASLSDDEVSELFGTTSPSQCMTVPGPSRPACVQRSSSVRGAWTWGSRDINARSEGQAVLNRRWNICQESHSYVTGTADDVGASQAIVIQRPSLDFDKMQRSCFGRKHVQNGINKPRVVKVRCFKTCSSSCTSRSSPAQLFDPAVFCFRSLSHHHQQQQQQQQQNGCGQVIPTTCGNSSSPVTATCSRCSSSSFAVIPADTTVKRSG